MNDTPVIRNYRPGDLERLTGLVIGQNRLAGTKESPHDIARSLQRPGFDPLQDLFVAEKNDDLVGYARITPQAAIDTCLLQGWIDPAHRKKGVAGQLLNSILERTGKLKIGSIRIAVSQENRTARAVLPKLGFKYVRRYLEMTLDPAGISDDQPLIHGLSFSRLSKEGIGALTDLLNRAFDRHWNYYPYDRITLAFDLSVYGRSPEDVILADTGNKTVGCCWTEIRRISGIAGTEQLGEINMLGVDPECRGKEYGKGTLLVGILHLKKRGVEKIILSVDSTNQPAGELYRAVGFTEYSSTLWYERATGYEDTQT